MTLAQAVAAADDLRPNAYDLTTKARWLSEVDGRALREVFEWHEWTDGDERGGCRAHELAGRAPEPGRAEGCGTCCGRALPRCVGHSEERRVCRDDMCKERALPPYDPDEGMHTALLIPEPYDGLYVHYLLAMIDFHNAEYTRYNNGMQLFNEVYAAFAAAVTRAVKPKQGHYIRF